MRHPRLRWLLTIGLAAAVYVGGSQLGFRLSFIHENVSSVRPPTALSLLLLLLWGRRLWPAIVIGGLVANLLHGAGVLASLSFGAGDALEALAAVGLLRLSGFRPQLERVRDVFALLLGAALISTLIGATIGTVTLAASAGLGTSSFWSVWHTWWLGDATRDLIVVPLVVTWVGRGIDPVSRARAIEATAFAVALGGIALIARSLPPSLPFLVMPVLIWGALRFGPRGAAIANAVLTGAGIALAAHTVVHPASVALVDRVFFTQNFIAIAAVTSLVLAAIIAERGRALSDLRHSEAAAKRLADEQAALGRVATAVARETPPQELFLLVASEVGRLIGAPEVLIVRRAGPGQGLVIGSWSQNATAPGAARPGAVVELDGRLVPIRARGREWGWLRVGPEVGFSALVMRRFAELLGLGLANADGRESLMLQASTDPLTGLANHRTFHERLADEVARARRYGRPLSVAMLDVDRFKQINDALGHLGGDEVLSTVAGRIAGVMRSDAIVARLGGDEIGIILPESDAAAACHAVERARAALVDPPVSAVGPVTVSAGVCDTRHGTTADRLLALADGALYWAKAHGRNACVPYSPEVVQELSDAERADRLARSQAVTGLRALARAIDAKDPATTRHSERVAELAVDLARARAWPEPRVELLREAALVHDVGKIGVPDTILTLPSRLSDEQYEQVKRHAALGAQIASEILDAEQVQWIRWHHERPDGRGYPDGLTDAELPEGAKLLALADAWEAMTSSRAYNVAKSVPEAIDECVRLGGVQFAPEAVQALLAVHATDASLVHLA